MRKEENILIGWDFIEYLEPENSVLARRDKIFFTQKSPYYQILIEFNRNLASDLPGE